MPITTDPDRNTADDWLDDYPIGDDEPGGIHDAPNECPAGGWHTWTNVSSYPDRMFDPYWHCDECGATP
jgi:hypothetical protein